VSAPAPPGRLLVAGDTHGNLGHCRYLTETAGRHGIDTVVQRYGERRNDEGFVVVRDALRYAPRGRRWTWHDTRFIALGGAHITAVPGETPWTAYARQPRGRYGSLGRRGGCAAPKADRRTERPVVDAGLFQLHEPAASHERRQSADKGARAARSRPQIQRPE